MNDLQKVLEDIRGLPILQKIKRVPSVVKAQVFGNDYINVYFLKSGYQAEKSESYYYVIIENGDNPIPPTLMTPTEIKEKLEIVIDDYY